MAKIKLPYVQSLVDRHGTARFYFRKPGVERVTLPGPVGSAAFMRVYETAIANAPKVAIGIAKTVPGTVSDLIVKFYASAAFKALKPATAATKRGIIERFRAEHGDKPVVQLQRRHVRDLVEAKADTPAAARHFLLMLRQMMEFAVEHEMIENNPTTGIKAIQAKTEGFASWTEDEIARFEAAHLIGSRARLAFALLLHTGQRRSDAVHIGRGQVHDGMIEVVQQKTGAALSIPIHAKLAEVIEGTPVMGLATFLTTAKGRPFTVAGFGNWFRDMVREAGLPDHCSPHGLRKAACRRLAESGCTAHEIMAISGHRSLSEVEVYTRAADQKKLARAAMAKSTT